MQQKQGLLLRFPHQVAGHGRDSDRDDKAGLFTDADGRLYKALPRDHRGDTERRFYMEMMTLRPSLGPGVENTFSIFYGDFVDDDGIGEGLDDVENATMSSSSKDVSEFAWPAMIEQSTLCCRTLPWGI